MLSAEEIIAEEGIDLLLVLPVSIDAYIVDVQPLLCEIKFGAQTATGLA